MIKLTAHAKINLALHVTGVREDGYHLLDSIVTFTEFGDRLTIEEGSGASGDIELSIVGPFADGLSVGEDNLVVSAANRLLKSAQDQGFAPRPVHICLEKNLPIASGIGGGSADAAAALSGLREFWGLGESIDLVSLARELGSDVPMCLHSRSLRATGTGDEIAPLIAKQPLHLLLVNPGVPVKTPGVFKRLRNKLNPPISPLGQDQFPSVEELSALRNDLQLPAIEAEPAIREVLTTIDGTGSRLTRMSGSGATCFGIYDDAPAAKAAAATIQERYPDWWLVATRSVTT